MIEIEDSNILESLFGHWPDFHDAELRAVRLEAPPAGPASLELDIEVAEMSTELDERGYYRDRQRCLAVLRFENVLNVRLDGFGYQNVLDALEISEVPPTERTSVEASWSKRRYRVALVPIAGFCEGDFLCDAVKVLSAVTVARAT